MARDPTFRIAIGALLFEGNTLSPVVTEIDAFEHKYLERGPALVANLRASNTEMGGAIRALELYGVEIVPLVATHGGAGGRVSARAYAAFNEMMLSSLRSAGRLDALYLALHGSFIAEGIDDMEGDLLAEIRDLVGEIPIAVSCDLHAHVTEKMTRHANLIVGYRHYPHDDTFDTGRRCVGLLLRTLRKQIQPVMRVRKAPMIVPAQKQRTKSNGPMSALHFAARTREAAGEVLAASYFPVQPWLDFEDVGFACVAITDRDPDSADRVALALAREAWGRRHEFDVPLVSARDAIVNGLQIDGGPIVLADAADCTGGGASGDSAIVLESLLVHGEGASATVLIVDPETVQAASAAGEGGRFEARIGNKIDPAYGAPLAADVEVLRLFDGQFVYSGGIFGGVTASMGPSALLQVGPVKVVIASYSSYEYGDEQLRAAGVDPRQCKFVVVKNPMNYQQAFDYALAAFTLDTPGPTTPDLRAPAWRNLRRPLFPLDDDFEPEFRAY